MKYLAKDEKHEDEIIQFDIVD